VSFETSFDSKQPKLEPKLVSALSETKRLFRLFRFFFETASFGVSVKAKLTEINRKKSKQAGKFTVSNSALDLFLLRHSVLSLAESVLQQSVHPGRVFFASGRVSPRAAAGAAS
jgi:hypothetical protein